MLENPIPDDVQKFLSEHVRSVAQLEILLLLNASPDRSWSVAKIYQTVLSNELLVEGTLAWFCHHGLAGKSESSYCFTASEAHRKVIRQLADLYRERPARIIEAIYKPKVSEIEEFAKAFKFRKDK